MPWFLEKRKPSQNWPVYQSIAANKPLKGPVPALSPNPTLLSQHGNRTFGAKQMISVDGFVRFKGRRKRW